MIEQCFKQKSSFRTIRIILFSLSMLFAYATNGYAQNMVRGVVTDVTGDPLPGVSVVVKGTTTGTTTDIDGRYSINVPSTGTLIFSYIGMAKHEVKTQGQTTINVSLSEDVSSLNEVVVVGYGTQKKVHLTGSVASASSKEILKTTASNISQALVGKLPGLVSQQSTGQPGADDVSFLVRGYSSYNGTSTPLVLVDGVEREMARIDASDIESVTILKDASSCAVYGMKGANGVILITTKQGTEGKPVITYRGSVTFNHATNLPKMMNGTQYMQYYNLARQLDNIANGLEPGEGFFTDEEIAATYNGDPTDGYENTDWTSPIYKTTMMHQHNLSVSGGTDKTKYFISGGFLRHNGIIKDHKNQRGNFRSNITTEINRNLNVQLNIAGNIQDYYRPGGYTYENQKGYNLFHLMLYSLPYVPQEYNGYPTSGYRQSGSAANAVYGSANSGFEKARNVRLETSAKIEYSFPFLKGLKASMFASWDYYDGDGKTFTYAYDIMAFTPADKNNANKGNGYSLVKSANLSPEGNMYVGNNKRQKVMLRPSISYNNKIGLHDIGALFLYEQKKENSSSLSGSRKDFDIFDLPELNFGDAATAIINGSSGKSAYAGYVGRLNYAYDNKYLVEASFRYDGSYLFAKGQRWGFFPSVSLGWVASEEDFFKDLLPKIDYFKLRGSVGILGNDNVDPFLYRKLYELNGNNVAFGTSPSSQSTLSNKVAYPMTDLTWEKCRTINLGFEMNAWNGLLGVEFDVFYKYTYDILQNITSIYPASLGGHVPTRMNDGTFDNKGFELILKHRNQIGDFNYSLTGNLTYAHNRILSKRQADGTLPWQSTLGSSIGDVWGLKSMGLYQTQEELDNAPKPIGTKPRLGDIRYMDINGDGQINSQDQVKIARNSRPELMFALMADANYKGFDLSIQLQGAALCDKMLQQNWYNLNGVTDQTPLTKPFYAGVDNAPLYLVENSWRPDNINAEYPRLSISPGTNNAQISDYWKRNGAYLRLKNVVLGYTFPKQWMSKLGVGSLRIYASGQNLLTFTEFKYLDPESANVITGYYPQQRTFSVGVDVSF